MPELESRVNESADEQETQPPHVSAPVSQTSGAGARSTVVPREGDILKGKYRLEEKIGEGGMGVVYRAVDLETHRFTPDNAVVAIKMLKPSLYGEESQAALCTEVGKTKTLQQENIVDVYAFEQDGPKAFMVMEYLTGRSLDKMLTEDYALGMPLATAWPIIEGMGKGLACAHAHGLVHSDFKPSNVLVTPVRPKVLDFGIARAAGRPINGVTAAYASCEMLEGLPADPRDDVYAFGIVCYKMLAGKHPFRNVRNVEMTAADARAAGRTPMPLPGLSRVQQAALAGALRFEREARAGSITAVLEALDPARLRRPWVVSAAMVTLLLALCAAGTLGAYRWLGPQPADRDSDESFVRHLLTPNAPRATEAEAQTAADLLELGDDFLKHGVAPFDTGLLSENGRPLSSALSAYRQALKVDPGNRAAAEGVVAVIHAYKAEAHRAFDAGNYRRAAELIQIGLRLWPDSAEFARLETATREKLDSRSDQAH